MEVTNIKYHIRLVCQNKCKEKYTQRLKEISAADKAKKRRNTFIVIRIEPFVITCFNSGYINVTGVKDFDSIQDPTHKISNLLEVSVNCLSAPVIDTISSRWNKEKHYLHNLPLVKIRESAKKEEKEKYISSWHRREQFPALFVKTKFGTLLWFVTPSVVAVGSKTKKDLEELSLVVDSIHKRAWQNELC